MLFNYQQKNKNINTGFTLIEIMVATSIFMMIMLIALGALVISSDTAKKAQAMRTAMDNISFAMESMTRSLRTGTDYTCITVASFILPADGSAPDCPISSSSGGIAIAFTPALHDISRDTAYVVNSRSDGTGVLQRCDVNTCVDIVSPAIDIQKLTFFVNGGLNNDLIQPNVYILLKGAVIIKGQPTVFAIQTNVSQRTSE